MKNIWSFIRHNSGIFISVVVCAAAVCYLYSCQSTVVSLVNPNRKLTRDQLVAEVDAYLVDASAKFEDLSRQDLVKETIFNSVLELAQGKAINPIGVALTLAGILGIGAGADNIRKRTHINTLKGESLNVKIKEAVEKIIARAPP